MAIPGNVYARSCSARDALKIISMKWSLLILPLLADQPMRNGELRRRVEGISQKMLTQTLRELERNGLIERLELTKKPAHVEYRISNLASSLVQTLVALDRWAEHNFEELDAARKLFDSRRRAPARIANPASIKSGEAHECQENRNARPICSL